MNKLVCVLVGFGMWSPVFAAVRTSEVRIYTGVPNSELAPFGSYVDLKSGEVLDVIGVISTMAPNQLDPTCIYQITYTAAAAAGITTVPPQGTVSCGHEFPKDR